MNIVRELRSGVPTVAMRAVARDNSRSLTDLLAAFAWWTRFSARYCVHAAPWCLAHSVLTHQLLKLNEKL
jgi:hypothetical protein